MLGDYTRTEKEMFDIIINTPRSDDRVLAAYLKGSRANPNAPRDIYQDFDIMWMKERIKIPPVSLETSGMSAEVPWARKI